MALKCYVYVTTSEKGKATSQFLLAFYTTNISIRPGATLDLLRNEAEAGGLFAAIRAHKRLSVLIPDRNPHTVHTFLLTPKNQPILEVTLYLYHETHTLKYVVDRPFHVQQEDIVSTRSAVSLRLSKVQLLSFLATGGVKDETYVANFRVMGGTEEEFEEEE